MSRNAWVHLAVALLAVTAIGVSATTYDSTVETDANDVIDLDYDQVPIGQDHASAVVDRVEQSQDDQDAEPVDSQSNTDETRESSGADSADGSADARSSQSEREDQTGGHASQDGGNQETASDSWFELLVTLLVVAGFLAGVTAIVQYGPRLHDHISRSESVPVPDTPGGDTDEWPGRPPANAVDHAWAVMVEHLDLASPTTRTPNECATAAIEAGLDRETVEALTEAFVEVRYGEQPVTERRERIARQSRQRFDRGSGA